MRLLLDPIKTIGITGIPMMGGDGIWRRCHPILASFVGDYPEQVLVTCTYNSRCPKCLVLPDQLGTFVRSPLRDYDKVKDVYNLSDGDAHVFHSACRKLEQKPVFHPFWHSLPLTNAFVSITPDILHQLLQGVFKHLLAWLIDTFGASEIDARCRSIPPNHHITIFGKGISWLSRVTGKEHKNMSRFLLGLVMDLPVPGGQVSPRRIIAVVWAVLDFLFLAQLPSHTTTTLARLDDALARFHDNKDVFVDLGIRNHFNLPKIHCMIHYSESIRLFGSTDNYNTKQTERLHIDIIKDAYIATNHKDEYIQMATWQQRREKIQVHYGYLKRRQQGNHASPPSATRIGPPSPGARRLKMSLHPTLRKVSFDDLAQRYGAVDFQDTLADFIAQFNNPTASAASLSTLAADTLIPFRSVSVHHRIKFTDLDQSEIVDSIQVRPEQKDARGRLVPSRFDTVLVRGKSQGSGIRGKIWYYHTITTADWYIGNRIAQVRVVFEIPSKVVHDVFLGSETTPPQHLAYVEWFSPIPANPGPNHLLYKVSRLTHHERRCASIIPVDTILRSVHLLPIFGQRMSRDWNSFSVLELCNTFYVNAFSDRDSHMIF